MSVRTFWAAVTTLSIAVLASRAPVVAQGAQAAQGAADQAPAIWRGVYTNQQADRGKTVFNGRCVACHGENASGGDGPPLLGNGFINNWLEDSLGGLFIRIHTKMPGDAPGTLTPQEA